MKAVERDLDAIDAVLGLAADLLDRLVRPDTRRPIEVSGAPIQVGYQSVRPWRRGQVAARGGDARALEQAGPNGVADREADLAGVAGRADRGVAGRDHLLREEQPADRAEFSGW